ncbi:DUF4179 domain-containing protein [Brevibacillus formosus]|uniref:DUF4179 domain-containing protein n=1 Tax=Brevibacillus formosus TaxID=54913 RepID=A0A837KJZ0_9BACL|nr:DUF4179 domain-containing protein [Brevibacillus formosus]KLH97445.1 hypothetical protein AA984_20115 [Brevibacillus formosus]MED1958224.1 DUF4179 domain-containing protein [Brevibacillus formosus]PSJ87967.1 DUF4179 domain-containing protein [Brevibacillus formosus]GED59908.1 hypothetical protein BFO01nite_40400 [Brevibacillus formosus]
MKCLDKGQIALYLYDLLEPEEAEVIAAHLEDCRHCQRRLKQELDALEDPEESLATDEPSEAVIHDIMANLPPYPIHILKRSERQKLQRKTNWKKRSLDIVKKATIAVAGIAAVVYFGTLTSPSFATYVHGLYASTIKPQLKQTQESSLFDTLASTNLLIQRGLQEGYNKKVDLKAVDNGMTLEVKEVMADSRDVRILFTIKDQNGKPIEDLFSRVLQDEGTSYELKITDKDGKTYTNYDEEFQIGHNDLTQVKGQSELIMLSRPIQTFFSDTSEIPDELYIDLVIKDVEGIDGKWNVTFPIDISKAKKDTKIVPIHKQYTAPNGELIDLKQVMVTPGQIEFVIENTLAEYTSQGLTYEIVDDTGAVLAKWSEMNRGNKERYPQPYYKNVARNYFVRVVDDTPTGKKVNFLTFHSLPTDKDLTFRVAATYQTTSADFEQKLSIDAMKNKPVTTEHDGNVFTFSNFTVKEETIRNEKRMSATMQLDATLAPGVADVDKFAAVDENGNKYTGYFKGSLTRDAKGNIVLSGPLNLVKDLKAIPKELTISIKEQLKENKDVDWSVTLPLKN